MTKKIESGTVIGGGYRLGEKLGQTSLGELYLATSASGDQVRIEILAGEDASDPEKVQRLLHEIELIASMDHPSITKAVDAGQDEGIYFLVTVHEPGTTLDKFLEANNPIAERHALEIAASIAAALNYAWTERKILHRDIKPSSIFITKDGKAKLLGFGIAKSSDSQQSMGLTGAGFTIGTPEYMSPEQIRAEENLDFRSDLYALGCVTYEMIAGSIPFMDAAPILIMHKHMDEDPEPITSRNPNASEGASAVVLKMLAKERDDRHSSWKELIDDLQQAMAGTGRAARPAVSTPAAAAAEQVEVAAPAPRSSSNAPAAAQPVAAQPKPAAPAGGPPVALIVGVVVVVIVIIAVIAMMK